MFSGQWAEHASVDEWDRLRRTVVGRLARGAGVGVEMVRVVLRAAEEVDRVKRGLLGEHEGEGDSLRGEAEGMEEEEEEGR